MKRWAEQHKPAAGVRGHLLLAWVMWAVVGASLLGFGITWSWQGTTPWMPWLIAAAITVSVLKSRLVLDPVARRIVDRIEERGDGRCLGGFLSPSSWLFVGAMAGTGRLLRGASTAQSLLGLLYIAVGLALLLSSRIAFRAWRESPRS